MGSQRAKEGHCVRLSRRQQESIVTMEGRTRRRAQFADGLQASAYSGKPHLHH